MRPRNSTSGCIICPCHADTLPIKEPFLLQLIGATILNKKPSWWLNLRRYWSWKPRKIEFLANVCQSSDFNPTKWLPNVSQQYINSDWIFLGQTAAVLGFLRNRNLIDYITRGSVRIGGQHSNQILLLTWCWLLRGGDRPLVTIYDIWKTNDSSFKLFHRLRYSALYPAIEKNNKQCWRLKLPRISVDQRLYLKDDSFSAI